MEQKGQNRQEQILVGIDVGSTTTKVAVMEAATGKVLFSDYTRHHSDQLQSVSRAVKLVKETLAGGVISDGDDRFGRKAPLGRAGDPLCTGGSGELDRLESHVRGNRNGDRAGWTGCEDYLFPEG